MSSATSRTGASCERLSSSAPTASNRRYMRLSPAAAPSPACASASPASLGNTGSMSGDRAPSRRRISASPSADPICSERFSPDLVRDQPILVGGPEEDDRAFPAGAEGKLLGEPALADPGLYDLRRTRRTPFPCRRRRSRALRLPELSASADDGAGVGTKARGQREVAAGRPSLAGVRDRRGELLGWVRALGVVRLQLKDEVARLGGKGRCRARSSGAGGTARRRRARRSSPTLRSASRMKRDR